MLVVVVIEAEAAAAMEFVEQLVDEVLGLVVLGQAEMKLVVELVERNSSHFEVEPFVLDLFFLHETY